MKRLPPITPSSFVALLITIVWLGWLVGVLLAGQGLNIFGDYRFDFELAGQFGDSFGSLSGLMASLAAAGAWYAVFLQRQESERQASDREKDDKVRRQQAFEQNFFQLLGHLAAIVRGTDIISRTAGGAAPKKYEGKDAYRRLLKLLRDRFIRNSTNLNLNPEQEWRLFYQEYQDDLGHYFRSLYHICNYVKTSSDVDRAFYMKYIFAQLSNSELILTGYNCALGRGKEKFKPILIEFECLTNIGFNNRIPYEEALFRKYFPLQTLPEHSFDISEN